ncbi:hypothetical protein G9A89_011090 [Geosiphon pyriformis]|nr:hypothetical protein G9A89_011090 [Geosiphon pyriformis]
MREEAFKQLRPLCGLLTKASPLNYFNTIETVNILDSLIDILQNLPDLRRVLFPDLIAYIFYPLRELYSNAELSKSDKFKEKFSKCLLMLLEAGWAEHMSPNCFKELFILFARIIPESESSSVTEQTSSKVISTILSEETKVVVIACILALLRGTEVEEQYNDSKFRPELIKELRQPALLPIVGIFISALVHVVYTEHLLELRLLALETLKVLICSIKYEDFLALCLPRVMSILGKTLLRDQKENHRLLIKTLEALEEIIIAAMNDDSNLSLIPRISNLSEIQVDLPFGNDSHQFNRLIQPQSSLSVQYGINRTKSWLKATKSQIKISLSQIFTIRNHPLWAVRLAFAKFSHAILIRCSKTLDNSASILIETLVLNLSDEYEAVSTPCRQYLLSLRNHDTFQENLKPILKESFNNWLTSLPRYIMSMDENGKFNAIMLLSGFILLLGSEIQTVLNLSLQQVSHGLIKALEFNMMDIQVTENRIFVGQYDSLFEERKGLDQRGVGISSEHELPSFLSHQFKYIREKRATSAIRILFRLLGYFGNVGFMIDHFLSYLHNLQSYRLHPTCIFITNELILGAASIGVKASSITEGFCDISPSNSLSDLRKIAKNLLREYIESNLIKEYENKISFESSSIVKYKDIEKITSSSKQLNGNSSLNYNPILNCIILEGVANISRVLQENFKIDLIYALYPILEKLGEKNNMVHETAQIVLIHIAHWCGYSSSKSLVLENVDYLINAVSRKLRQIHLYPKAPQVLSAMVNVAGSSILTFLDDSLEEIFDAIDQYHTELEVLFQMANVLYTIVTAISRPKKEETKKFEKNSEREPPKVLESGLSKDIQDFIVGYSPMNPSDSKEDNQEKTNFEDVGKYFVEYHKNKEKEELNEQGIIEAEREKPEIKPSQPQLTCLNCINKVMHSLTVSSPQLRALILELIRISLPTLRSIPHELFPLIHRIWPSIINRLKDKEHYVVLAAVRLIESISISCGDFLSKRVLDDVWPMFQNLLQQQSTMGRESAMGSSPFSKSHQIQTVILRTIRVIINRVVLKNEILFQIMDNTWIFLSDEFHDEIQNAARQCYMELAKKVPDAVWLLCGSLGEENDLIIKEVHDPLLVKVIWPRYFFRVSKGHASRFKRNIMIISDKLP